MLLLWYGMSSSRLKLTKRFFKNRYFGDYCMIVGFYAFAADKKILLLAHNSSKFSKYSYFCIWCYICWTLKFCIFLANCRTVPSYKRKDERLVHSIIQIGAFVFSFVFCYIVLELQAGAFVFCTIIFFF